MPLPTTIPHNINVELISSTFPSLAPKLISKGATNRHEVNWLSVPDITSHLHLFNPAHIPFFSNLLNLSTQFYTTGHHLSNGLAFLCSEGYRAEDTCYCLSNQMAKKYRPCGSWRLCPKCAWYKAQKMVRRFLPLWPVAKGNFYHVTVRPHAPVDFVLGHDKAWEFWDKAANTMTNISRRGKVTGAIYVEEYALVSLTKNLFLPHCHILMFTDDIEKATKNFAKDFDIKITAPKTQADFERLLAYPFKSVDLYHRYITEWTPETSPLVNRQLEAFTQGIGVLTYKRLPTRFYGICRNDNSLLTIEN